MASHPHLLHPTYLKGPVTPNDFGHYITSRSESEHSLGGFPEASVVIQSCNDEPWQMGGLLNDLVSQEHYSATRTQLIVTNAVGSNERRTLDIARSYGAAVIDVDVGPGFRADMVNKGIEAADHRSVVTLPGHAREATTRMLGVAVAAIEIDGAAGAYGVALPGEVSSRTERIGAKILSVKPLLDAGIVHITSDVIRHEGMGLLSSDASVVDRDVVRKLGGYPTNFGAGGHDGALGARMVRQGFKVLRIPLLSRHHTHGHGPVDAVRQLFAWGAMNEPNSYDAAQWRWHPNGGI